VFLLTAHGCKRKKCELLHIVCENTICTMCVKRETIKHNNTLRRTFTYKTLYWQQLINALGQANHMYMKTCATIHIRLFRAIKVVSRTFIYLWCSTARIHIFIFYNVRSGKAFSSFHFHCEPAILVTKRISNWSAFI